MKRLLIAAAALLAPPVAAQTAPQAALPKIRSADRTVEVRAQPTQSVDDTGARIDPRSPLPATSTSTAITLGAADAFQQILAAQPARLGCMVQRKGSGGIVRIFLGSPAQATAGRSVDINPGEVFNCVSTNGVVVTDTLSAAGSVAATPILVVSQ